MVTALTSGAIDRIRELGPFSRIQCVWLKERCFQNTLASQAPVFGIKHTVKAFNIIVNIRDATTLDLNDFRARIGIFSRHSSFAHFAELCLRKNTVADRTSF